MEWRKNNEMRLMGLDRFSYPLYRDKVVSLYKEVFTTGEYAQKITNHEAEQSLDATMRYGFGKMALEGQRVVALVIAMPLEKHSDFPPVETIDMDQKSVLYIAEVAVHPDFRNMGLGTTLLQEILNRPAGYTAVLIRVWEENRPACMLYKKLGFRPIAAISQTKRRPWGEPFEMRKIYFLKQYE